MNKKNIEASKLFLESERGAGNSKQPNEESSKLNDLIKCFCGICETWFKRKSIEFALKSNGEEILRDEEARNILKKFTLYRKNGSNFKTPMEEIINCFELSMDILNGQKDLEEHQDELTELCYTEYWEEELTDAIEKGRVDDYLHRLSHESAVRLENNEEFSIFKQELKRKLKLDK